MNTFFQGKVAIITGSSRGIGRALALHLAKKGAKLVLNSRTSGPLMGLLDELNELGREAIAVQGDVTIAEDCKRLAQQAYTHYGRIDILVNNVGLAVAPATMMEMRPEVFQVVLSTNFLSAVFMTQAALPFIKESKGSVLFISSLAAVCGFPEGAAYSPAKMALTAFSETLRLELAGQNVHIGIAYIGFTENMPGKTILGPDGQMVPKQHTYQSVKPEKLEKVAKRLGRMLEKKQFKSYFTCSGKILVLLYKFSPALLWLILLAAYRRKLKTDK